MTGSLTLCMTPTSVWFPFVVISFVVVGWSDRPRQLGSKGCEANCRCLAVTDRYTGAILPLETGLLTVFLNREVTVLLGLTSYTLLWENHLGLSQGDHNGGVTGLVMS